MIDAGTPKLQRHGVDTGVGFSIFCSRETLPVVEVIPPIEKTVEKTYLVDVLFFLSQYF